MWWTGHLLVMVLVAGVRSEYSIADEFQNLSRVHFDTSEKFGMFVSYRVFHMGLDLYKDDGSILFTDKTDLKTTNGNMTTVVISGFVHLSGFKQLNSTHVAVVDTVDQCVWMVNRKGNPRKRLLAGICGTYVYRKGNEDKFSSPWSIELDVRNPGHLLVAEYGSHKLSSIEIATGKVSKVIQSGFRNPTRMVWNNDRLLVISSNYISEVSWDRNGLVTNTRLAGSIAAGFVDGDFNSSRFDAPYDIIQLEDGFYLIADYSSDRLRMLDLNRRRVSTVCIARGVPCTEGTAIRKPCSLLRSDDAVYACSGSWIIKLTGYQCYAQNNITAYVYSDQEKANVRLNSGDVRVFPVGEYQFRKKYGANNCIYYVNVLVAPITRTAAFQTMYDVTCANLDNKVSRALLRSVIARKNAELKITCGKDCRMSSTMQPLYTCEKNFLTVHWPTDQVFPPDVKVVPNALYRYLRKVAEASTLKSFELPILSHTPPLVPPRRNHNGETVQIVLVSTCTQKNQQYQKDSDTCV